MAQEEHTPRCSNSSSGGGDGGGRGGGGGSHSHRSSKKLKHKKVPQRGMGVAQLEKIISEEHQKQDVAIFTPNSIISPTNSSSLVPNFRPPPISLPSIPPPPPLPPYHQPLIAKTDSTNHPISMPISSSKPMSVSGAGGNNWCRLWSGGEYNFEGENLNQNQNQGLDHRGCAAAFQASSGGLPYESNTPIWPPPPNVMQRSQFFHPPCSSSMVNVSAGASSSSSIMNFQIEPPSNQSYCGNKYPPMWPEEEQMVGMKRSYPFLMEDVPIPPFHCKFPSAYIYPISRLDESASCSNGGAVTMEPNIPAFRDNPSSSSAISDPITKDFLTLAPPQASQSRSSSKEKLHPSSYIGELPQFETLVPPHQGERKDPTSSSGRGGSKPQAFLSFFPPAKTAIRQAEDSNGEAGETVDLNLKL